MNVRLLAIGALLSAASLQPVHAAGVDFSKFRRIEAQYIAALGDPGAKSGSGAQSWGLWDKDPGPRGCKLDRFPELKATGVTPLADGATLYDVTHLGCRSARYTPMASHDSCSPENARKTGYPILPGMTMPDVKGCRKQDYTVLIVVGLPVTP